MNSVQQFTTSSLASFATRTLGSVSLIILLIAALGIVRSSSLPDEEAMRDGLPRRFEGNRKQARKFNGLLMKKHPQRRLCVEIQMLWSAFLYQITKTLSERMHTFEYTFEFKFRERVWVCDTRKGGVGTFRLISSR